MENFKPYRLIELHFQGEVKKSFLIGPLEDKFADRALMRDIFSNIYRALVDTENTNLGLGLALAHPDHRINVTMEVVDSWDDSETSPIPLRSVMVEQMISIFKKSLFVKQEAPKPKWTVGRVLKHLWMGFIEFLDNFGEEAKKNPDLFGNTHNWV